MVNINQRGMALIPALTISLAVFLLGFAAMYISEMGYRSISAEARWQMLEKVATGQAKKFAVDVINGTKNCGSTVSGSLNSINYQVASINAGGSCFIWSSATMGNIGRVTKVSYIPLMSSNYGALMFKNPGNLNISGDASISGCDSNCPQYAMMGGDYPQNYKDGGNNFSNLLGNCNSKKGLISHVSPQYKVDDKLINRDLLGEFFNIGNNNTLEQRITELYKVKFNNNGEPIGIEGPQCNTSSIDVSVNQFLPYIGVNLFGRDIITLNNFNPNQCEANGKNISCQCSGNSNINNINITCSKMNFYWDENNKRYEYKLDLSIVGNLINLSISGLPIGNCNAINLGTGTTLKIAESKEFEGGGTIYSGNIELKGNSKNNLNIIAYNDVKFEKNNIEIENMNIFTKNLNLSKENVKVLNSLIYSGGNGSGNINISLNGNSEIGSINKPTIIVSNNNIPFEAKGNTKFYGFMFETSQSNNLNINLTGNASIEGLLISNTTANRHSNVKLDGNSKIKFNSQVLANLSNKFVDLIKPITCGGNVKRDIIWLQTMTTVY